MRIDEYLDTLKQNTKDNSDIGKGISELFKDPLDDPLEQHPADIRTRLIQDEISSMALANYLDTIHITGLKPREDLIKPTKANKSGSLGVTLNLLMFQLKRHKMSMKGQSRREVVEILKGGVEKARETTRRLFGAKAEQ